MRDVLRQPGFRLLFSGLVASMVGESILLLALAVWVKDLTGSNGLAGATVFAVIAPMVLAPMVGWVVDRFRRRPFLIAANLLTAVVLSPLLLVSGRDDIWIIYTVGALYGLSYIAINAALSGLLKLVVPADLLADANGALQTVKQGLRLAGPLLGAGLYATFGGWPLAIIAGTGFVLAAIAIAAMRTTEERPVRTEVHWLVEVAAGLRHVSGHPALRRATIGTAAAVLAFGFSESAIFAYVDEGLGRSPAFVGVLSSAQGLGGLLGGLLAARVIRRLAEVGAMGAGILGFALGTAALIYPSMMLGMAGMLMAGLGLPVIIVALMTLIQRSTPAAMLGRVSAATDAMISAPQAASIAVGALLVSLVDYRWLLAAMTAGMVVSGVYLWRARLLSDPAPTYPAVPAPDQPDPGMSTSTVPTPTVPTPTVPVPAVPAQVVRAGTEPVGPDHD